jgi:hypothetical protein
MNCRIRADELLTAADTSTMERMAVGWATFRETTLALQDRTLVRAVAAGENPNSAATTAGDRSACSLVGRTHAAEDEN